MCVECAGMAESSSLLFSSKSSGLPHKLILLIKVTLKGIKTLLDSFLCVCKRMCVILCNGRIPAILGSLLVHCTK